MKTRMMQPAVIAVLVAWMALPFSSAWGQVGKGLVDPNVAAEAELLKLPNMTPAIVKELVAKRPFMSARALPPSARYCAARTLAPYAIHFLTKSGLPFGSGREVRTSVTAYLRTASEIGTRRTSFWNATRSAPVMACSK